MLHLGVGGAVTHFGDNGQRIGVDGQPNVEIYQDHADGIKLCLEKANQQIVEVFGEGLQLGGAEVFGNGQLAQLVLHHHAQHGVETLFELGGADALAEGIHGTEETPRVFDFDHISAVANDGRGTGATAEMLHDDGVRCAPLHGHIGRFDEVDIGREDVIAAEDGLHQLV